MSSEQETLESSILGSMDNLLNTSTMQEASSEDSDENFILQKSKNVTKRSSRDTIAPRLMELEATVQVLKETSEDGLSRVARAQLALDLGMKKLKSTELQGQQHWNLLKLRLQLVRRQGKWNKLHKLHVMKPSQKK